MILLIEAALLLLALITAVAVVRLKNLFAATIVLAIYSLVMAMSWTIMQALDVAFTEAAVGAGISTILLLGALVHVGSKEAPDERLNLAPLLAVVLTGALLIYGTLDMAPLGDPNAPVHQRVSAYYAGEASHHRTHAPNVVTAVLASYRGFDTMFETAVIFTAGAGMILLLRRPEEEDEAEGAA
ncbi:MAG TPA: cation:proton antiporter [Planctomycetes bacterium]|nr:cation:proton antiporter [Planctomycetota bacterium]